MFIKREQLKELKGFFIVCLFLVSFFIWKGRRAIWHREEGNRVAYSDLTYKENEKEEILGYLGGELFSGLTIYDDSSLFPYGFRYGGFYVVRLQPRCQSNISSDFNYKIVPFKEGKIEGEVIAYSEEIHDYTNINDYSKMTNYTKIIGVEKVVTNYKGGRREGKEAIYYKTGKIKEISNYKNDEKDGKDIKYYETGEIKEIINYKNGSADWKGIKYYNKDGTIKKSNKSN